MRVEENPQLHQNQLKRRANLDFFHIYSPLMVKGGYICSTCSKIMKEEEWVVESMGQCKNCWETNPEPVPTNFDLEVMKEIKNEEEL